MTSRPSRPDSPDGPTGLRYRHVDVFADRPYTGNSLAVFPDASGLTGAQMLAITQELRHFETVFLSDVEASADVTARVFDLFEELDFAGHPVLGAAAVLHERAGGAGTRRRRFRLTDRQDRRGGHPTHRRRLPRGARPGPSGAPRHRAGRGQG
jgi:hypothetical protein